MFPLLRSFLFLFLGGLCLTAHPLCAQESPPLPPRPSTQSPTLNGLRALSGAPATPSQPIPMARKDAKLSEPERLPPPQRINQTSFSTPTAPTTISTLTNDSENETTSEDKLFDTEPAETHNEILNKPLTSKKLTKDNDATEEGESAVLGWKNKLAKPELTPLFSVGGSLLIVVAAFLLLVIIFRKVAPQGNRLLPKEAFECLGRYYLTQKHQLQVLRLGNRIVLVSVMPDEVSTLAEITDPDEAVSFLGLCRRLDNNSATEMFRKTVASMSEDELNRSHDRPFVTRRKPQGTASFDTYSDPDESLATLLARGRHNGR